MRKKYKYHAVKRLLRKHTNKSFLIFTCVLFAAIFLIAFFAFTVSVRQINQSHVWQQLTIASEAMRLRLETTVNSEILLVRKMADTPVIRQYFMNPSDPELEAMAFLEFAIYQEYFSNKIVFWINDIDKIFYSTMEEPYLVDPNDPTNYWYDLTLQWTEQYNLNINYNPDLQQINLWVNVPVFTETENGGTKPIGMLGTGINLAYFSDFIAYAYREFDKNITPYMFNEFHEITAAMDYDIVHNKVRLNDHLGSVGEELLKVSNMLTDAESRSFIYGGNMYMVTSIPAMEWYLVVSYPLPGMLALNQSMNIQFFGMIALILILFVAMNIFYTRSEKILILQNQISIMLSQIQPHFLFNSLAAIRELCKTNPAVAEETIVEFSEYLRGNIDALTINETIPFERELYHTKNYLAIEKKRFTNLLNIEYDIKIKDFNMPVLTLQPIVENAVRYGVTQKEDGGTVCIKTEETEDSVIITVTDNGAGFDTEPPVQEQPKLDGRSHVGIKNVRSRLAAMCKGTLSIQSEPGEGTVATIKIPLKGGT